MILIHNFATDMCHNAGLSTARRQQLLSFLDVNNDGGTVAAGTVKAGSKGFRSMLRARKCDMQGKRQQEPMVPMAKTSSGARRTKEAIVDSGGYTRDIQRPNPKRGKCFFYFRHFHDELNREPQIRKHCK